MKREELQNMKVAELKAICKENGIHHYNGKNCFKKDELVEAILGAEKNAEVSKKSAKDKVKTDDHDEVEAAGQSEKKAANIGVDMEQKMPYIESATVDTLVAFRLPNGKVKSAKIIKKSTQNRKFMVETDYGAQYVIKYEDVVWVRSGKRWPRGVYKLLKGLVGADGAES